MRAASERLLDASMLIAERDFQVQHFLARALKTKMARFDDSRMDRADCDFVNLAPIDAKEFCVGGRVAAGVGFANGLEPRVAFGRHAVLLPDFALEQVRLRMRDGERGITAGERFTSPDRQRVVGVEGEHGNEPCPRTVRQTEPGAQTRAATQFAGRRANKVRHEPRGHFRPRHAGAVGQEGKWSCGAHGVGKS